jgi:hypothetical protein
MFSLCERSLSRLFLVEKVANYFPFTLSDYIELAHGLLQVMRGMEVQVFLPQSHSLTPKP